MNKIIIDSNQNDDYLFKIFIFESNKKENYFSETSFLKHLNIHKGTFKRWMELKKIPFSYFNLINSFFKTKYSLEKGKNFYKINDMFFTDLNQSKKLINFSLNFIKENFKLNIKEYSLIEPSAGDGSFYFQFPKEFKTIGMDLNSNNKKIKEMNYLNYFPKDQKNIVIGNPPFGLRGNLALNFINHSAKFSDFICFILPPIFNSNGKGSPMLRINKDFYLAKEIKINNKYYYPNGKEIEVISIFQIWTKLFSKKIKPILPPEKKSEWVKVYSLSNGNSPSSRRNINMIDKCDYYLPSTTFKEISLKNKFEDLPHNRGYGIKILKNNKEIKKAIEETDWSKSSFKSTNNANNLRIQIIINEIERRMKSNVYKN